MPSSEVQQINLLANVSSLLQPFGYISLSNDILLQVTLYGDEDIPDDLNKNILLLSMCFINRTGWLDQEIFNTVSRTTLMSLQVYFF